ncbi:glutathione S-transferase family protein [Proteus faecis]|uniref:Glutathione S-transferase n=1 Tax=Proteus faecis TaxID=2050967 RepID=A0AAW7CNX9_9GAMM|nr:glutathione S-transferase [Proteus faecis]QNH66760.1 glutathione S-transferase [Proteus vulgaris]MCT8248177.1 glutathione S-transferase [Proteus faecis]MDL5165666.1 glutathione S-transferase [Proteus faecis]MDL5274070.1 glutathione S-transferase [Proteus faecis]MDL5277640.1 glutathione S-transferase [Proteus faecis]
MLKVWGRKNSSNVKKVLWCLKELNVPYEQIDVGGPFGGLNEANYLAINPNASIPTLQDDDFALWESNTIIRYLCTKYENNTLYPIDLKQRANIEKWMDWSNGSLFAPIQQMMIMIVRTPKEQQNPEIVNALKEKLNKLIKIADDQLAKTTYFAGDAFSLADIAIAPLVYPWLEVCKDRPHFPHIERWFAQLSERPIFRDIVLLPVN